MTNTCTTTETTTCATYEGNPWGWMAAECWDGAATPSRAGRCATR